MKQMSCSGRLARPFIRLLAGYSSFASKRDQLSALHFDDRVAVDRAYKTLLRWVERTGDADLGLKAGQTMCLGAAGVLDFAMHSANSIRDSMSIAHRYARLFSDALLPSLEVGERRASVRLEHKLPAPRVVRDFTMSSWFASHLRVQLAEPSEVEVWFSYEQPSTLAEYRRAFGPVVLKFGKEYDGFVFDADQVDAPLASADALLHALHIEHLEMSQADLPDQPNLTARVHQLVAGELRRGRPTALGVARQLHMSQRTLVRRLEAEGTSFSALLDDMRRQLALRFVCSPRLPLSEVTNLLGFSHVQGFHRAFKRWTGQTPIQYRMNQARNPPTAPERELRLPPHPHCE